MTIDVPRFATVSLGAVLVALAGLPFIWALINGFDPLGDEPLSTTSLTLCVAIVGLLAILSATTRKRVFVWALLGSVLGIVSLGGWVNHETTGNWIDSPWRLLILAAIAGVPSALMLVSYAGKSRIS